MLIPIHDPTTPASKPPDLDEAFLAAVDRASLAAKQQDPFQAHRTAFLIEDQMRTSRGSHFQ